MTMPSIWVAPDDNGLDLSDSIAFQDNGVVAVQNFSTPLIAIIDPKTDEVGEVTFAYVSVDHTIDVSIMAILDGEELVTSQLSNIQDGPPRWRISMQNPQVLDRILANNPLQIRVSILDSAKNSIVDFPIFRRRVFTIQRTRVICIDSGTSATAISESVPNSVLGEDPFQQIEIGKVLKEEGLIDLEGSPDLIASLIDAKPHNLWRPGAMPWTNLVPTPNPQVAVPAILRSAGQSSQGVGNLEGTRDQYLKAAMALIERRNGLHKNLPADGQLIAAPKMKLLEGANPGGKPDRHIVDHLRSAFTELGLAFLTGAGREETLSESRLLLTYPNSASEEYLTTLREAGSELAELMGQPKEAIGLVPESDAALAAAVGKINDGWEGGVIALDIGAGTTDVTMAKRVCDTGLREHELYSDAVRFGAPIGGDVLDHCIAWLIHEIILEASTRTSTRKCLEDLGVKYSHSWIESDATSAANMQQSIRLAKKRAYHETVVGDRASGFRVLVGETNERGGQSVLPLSGKGTFSIEEPGRWELTAQNGMIWMRIRSDEFKQSEPIKNFLATVPRLLLDMAWKQRHAGVHNWRIVLTGRTSLWLPLEEEVKAWIKEHEKKEMDLGLLSYRTHADDPKNDFATDKIAPAMKAAVAGGAIDLDGHPLSRLSGSTAHRLWYAISDSTQGAAAPVAWQAVTVGKEMGHFALMNRRHIMIFLDHFDDETAFPAYFSDLSDREWKLVSMIWPQFMPIKPDATDVFGFFKVMHNTTMKRFRVEFARTADAQNHRKYEPLPRGGAQLDRVSWPESFKQPLTNT